MSATREQEFITEARVAVRQIWDGVHKLLRAQTEWNALDYGNTLDAGSGGNDGILAADVGACVFAAADELKLRILDTGYATNLAKLL